MAKGKTSPLRSGRSKVAKANRLSDRSEKSDVPLGGQSVQSLKAVRFVQARTGTTIEGKRFLPDKGTFGSECRTAFRFAYTGAVATSTSTAGSFNVISNSMFDPSGSAGARQPQYYDTMCGADASVAPYKSYSVVKTHFRVTFISAMTGTSGGIVFAQAHANSALSNTCDRGEYSEQPNTAMAFIGDYQGANAVVVLEGTIDHALLCGFKDPRDIENFKAAYNANPAVLSYLTIGFRTHDSTTQTVYVYVELVFDAILSDLNDVASSSNASLLTTYANAVRARSSSVSLDLGPLGKVAETNNNNCVRISEDSEEARLVSVLRKLFPQLDLGL